MFSLGEGSGGGTCYFFGGAKYDRRVNNDIYANSWIEIINASLGGNRTSVKMGIYRKILFGKQPVHFIFSHGMFLAFNNEQP
jgi:hypothetical protein